MEVVALHWIYPHVMQLYSWQYMFGGRQEHVTEHKDRQGWRWKEEGLRTTEEKADLVLTLEWVSGERREGKGAPGRLRAVFSVRFVQADRGRRRKLRTPRLYDPCGFCSISRGNRQIPGETEQESKIKLKWVWTKMLMREEWGDPSSSRFPRLRPQNSLTSAGNFYF